MLCLKKVYRDELLQLAILLSLLRVDRRSSLGYDYDVPAIGVGIDNIQGWEQSHSLIRRDIQIHPKSLDSVLLNYEQQVFEDLNSLGRYNRINSLQDVTAYLLNVDGNTDNNTDNGNDTYVRTEDASRASEGGEASGVDLSEVDVKLEPYESELADYPLNGTLFNAEDLFFKEEEDFSAGNFLDSLPLELKGEPHPGEELTQEDMELIEVLWKQDVDMGFTMDTLQPQPELTKPAPDPDPKANSTLSQLLDEPLDKLPDLDDWDGLPYTVDGETGEYVLKEDINVTSLSVDEPPSALLHQPDFSLEQAFQLVCLDESCTELGASAEPKPDSEKDSEEGAQASDADPDLELLTEMIQTPQYHHAHARPFQGRMPYVRTMSMEQRWQDLATLLSLPDPSHAYHHFHPPGYSGGPSYSADRSVLLHNASLAPPMGEINNSTHYQSLGSSSNLGNAVATSMNLTNSSEPIGNDHQNANFKVENPHDMMYYQNGTAEMNHTDGFLSSILNDEDLQLMDMAMNEVQEPNRAGMYTMRMLEGAGVGAGQTQTERTSATDSDSAVSSMGSERVPSLSSDNEWMETNSDSGHTPADHYATDYHGKLRWYDYGYPGRQHTPDNMTSHRVPQTSVAQKKHHMYGKRYFQEQGAGSSSNSSMPVGSPAGVKFDFNSSDSGAFSTLHHEAKASPEMKYSCSVEFSRHLHTGMRAPVEHVIHNHTYHLPPDQTGAMQRPLARDKQKSRRSDEEPLTRDEKKARSMSIPITVADIINLPMDEFNERLSKYDLSESQLSLIRDIRRRGKNKVAAQNCRKRKLDQIMSLADEVKQMRDRKHRLHRERDYLVSETQRMKNKYTQLYRHIFQALRDAEGNPYSPYEWSLQQSADGSVLLVPRSTSSLVDSEKHKDSDPRSSSRKP